MIKPQAIVAKSSPLWKFAAGGGGFAAAFFGLKKLDAMVPASFPMWVKNLAPGVATMIAAWFFSTKVTDDRAKALLLGLGAGGFVDALRKTVPALAAYTPTLSGLGANIPYKAFNTGDFPISYYRENAFQGLGNPYALNGAPGIPMNGSGAYALSGNNIPMNGGSPYALN